jgi:hypothetical protein
MLPRILLCLALIGSTTGYGWASTLAINTQDEAIAAAKRLCRHAIPTDGSKVQWGAISRDQKTWGTWKGYGNGWEVHGRYTPRTKDNSLSVVDIIVFIPTHGHPSRCGTVST